MKVGAWKMSIRFCGMINDFSDLEHGKCPPEAHRLKEGESLDEILSNAMHYTIPLMILTLALSVVRIHKGLNWEMGTDIWEIIVVTLGVIFLYGMLVFAHEYVHILFYPWNADKEIWIYDSQVALVYCNTPMTRGHFMVMCLAPLTLLGFIPFILWMLFAQIPSPTMSIAWMLLCWSMIFGGLGDYYNVANVLSQVPRGALVFNYGMHTYWIEKKDWPEY